MTCGTQEYFGMAKMPSQLAEFSDLVTSTSLKTSLLESRWSYCEEYVND